MPLQSKICDTELVDVCSSRRINWDKATLRSFYQLMALHKLSQHIRPPSIAIQELWSLHQWERQPGDKVQLVVLKILRWFENHTPAFVREENSPEGSKVFSAYWPASALKWADNDWDGDVKGFTPVPNEEMVINSSHADEQSLSLAKAATVCLEGLLGQEGLIGLYELTSNADMSDVEITPEEPALEVSPVRQQLSRSPSIQQHEISGVRQQPFQPPSTQHYEQSRDLQQHEPPPKTQQQSSQSPSARQHEQTQNNRQYTQSRKAQQYEQFQCAQDHEQSQHQQQYQQSPQDYEQSQHQQYYQQPQSPEHCEQPLYSQRYQPPQDPQYYEQPSYSQRYESLRDPQAHSQDRERQSQRTQQNTSLELALTQQQQLWMPEQPSRQLQSHPFSRLFRQSPENSAPYIDVGSDVLPSPTRIRLQIERGQRQQRGGRRVHTHSVSSVLENYTTSDAYKGGRTATPIAPSSFPAVRQDIEDPQTTRPIPRVYSEQGEGSRSRSTNASNVQAREAHSPRPSLHSISSPVTCSGTPLEAASSHPPTQQVVQRALRRAERLNGGQQSDDRLITMALMLGSILTIKDENGEDGRGGH